MANVKHEILTGLLVDEVTEITIDDLTQFCAVRREKIVELVSEGIIEPSGRHPEEWRFSSHSMSRAGKAIRLESDLELDLHAVAVVLNLLDQIDRLHMALADRR